MGSFILCHEKKANQPFFLEDVHLNIYSIEELCFYLCNNLYLLNRGLLTKDLCGWIETELNMTSLAADLLRSVESNSLNRFVVTILAYVGFCDEEELDEIQHILMSLRDQTVEEQRKKRADNLLKNGKYEHAIIEYDRILREESNSKMSKDFFGKVHHNKGSALAKQFLFQQAAEEFLEAYNMAGMEETIKEYFCACFMYMSPEEYRELLDENDNFRNVAEKMSQEYTNQERQYRFYQQQKVAHTSTSRRIEEIKEEYRKSLV